MKQRLQAWGDTKILPIVGVFVFDEHGELLLLRRHTKDLGGGQWGTPGGRIDPGEDADTAIRRELYEETGLQGVTINALGSHLIRMPHGTVHLTSYRTVISRGVRIVVDPEEHHAYAWFTLDGLLDEGNLLWGLPSVLRDFGLFFGGFDEDPTLADGSSVELVRLEK